MFKIAAGILRRTEFRGVEGQGMDRPFWPFQAEKKEKKRKEEKSAWKLSVNNTKTASIVLNFLRDLFFLSFFFSFFYIKLNREHA